jgi:hypothetical protein
VGGIHSVRNHLDVRAWRESHETLSIEIRDDEVYGHARSPVTFKQLQLRCFVTEERSGDSMSFRCRPLPDQRRFNIVMVQHDRRRAELRYDARTTESMYEIELVPKFVQPTSFAGCETSAQNDCRCGNHSAGVLPSQVSQRLRQREDLGRRGKVAKGASSFTQVEIDCRRRGRRQRQ